MMKQNENEMNFSVPLEIIKASEIEPKEVKWLWYPYIPFGKVTLLQGDPGDGKSKLMLSIAALLSKGEPLPFTETEENEPMTIQNRLAQGKGPAYERWAKVYNIKQMAAALLYLREHGLTDYAALSASTEAAVDRAHKLAGELRDTEAALSHTAQLMGAVVQYAKTRPVFDGYKAARYSKKYLAQHEAELSDYRAAKAAMSDLLGGAKLPKMDALKKQRRELAEKKKALYAEYRKAQADMREAVAVKGNIDCLLGHTDERNKAQER